MLLYFFFPLSKYIGFLNVIRYPSFRILMALLTSGLITFSLYPLFIRTLRRISFSQYIREDGPKTHLSKQGTPTMGGLLMLLSILLSSLLWCDLSYASVWILLWVLLGFGFLGFLDDFQKIKYKNSKGISPRAKLLGQIFFGLSALVFWSMSLDNFDSSTLVALPFVAFDKFFLQLPWWLFFPFALFIVVGTSNAVNLTDGLDGLAIVPIMVSSFVFLIFAYAASAHIAHLNIAEYLKIPPVAGGAELAIFCASIIGAGCGFLWFNAHPASIIMGDVGALSLGACLGMLAIMTKNEIISAFINGVFLMETLSVIMQVLSFKLFKKRIFKMAPIHHHFELLGWPEPKVIVRFWIIAALLGLVSILSLKIR